MTKDETETIVNFTEAEGYCDEKMIADWKLELMAKRCSVLAGKTEKRTQWRRSGW